MTSKKTFFKKKPNHNPNTNKPKPTTSDSGNAGATGMCKEHCTNGFIYDFTGEEWDINRTDKSVVDKYKTATSFYQDKFVYTYNEIPYLFDFEPTIPKPKSVIHWGQLKMFLVTLLFLINKVNPAEKEVHIIYPGSARGDNILILCKKIRNRNSR
jgi:hypothetical protein